jgi:hypothetical protein
LKQKDRVVGVLIFFIFFPLCCSTPVRSTEIIIGKWLGDPENARIDPEIKKEYENNPMGEFFLKAMEEFYLSLRVEITKDSLGIDMQIPGEEPRKETITYKVTATTINSVTIESTIKDIGGGKLIFTIIDRDHIKIVSFIPSDEEPAFILKRVQ